MAGEKIEIENIKQPGARYRVDAAKYHAARAAYLQAIAAGGPALTVAEIAPLVRERLPQDLFPGGATAGWWTKAVQLDLEAKGVLVRDAGKPLRLRRA
ncbi:hypothetical protein [Phenylobacterium sp.]|uniref:DUF6958 family protein n=1 Tax=Phenylobacterium sp. TaxID=1871053 RepID=UPI002734111C|nr:hypothetical protein [Phenylobacterium sp.]MDP3658419.1 hypothetical protein [Phenylobacterium sp.]